jgi:hypothetical protein
MTRPTYGQEAGKTFQCGSLTTSAQIDSVVEHWAWLWQRWWAGSLHHSEL